MDAVMEAAMEVPDPQAYIAQHFHTIRIPQDKLSRCNMALTCAAENGDAEMVVRMLNIPGVDVHWRGDAALTMAAKNGQTEVVYYLIEAGADVHANADAALRVAVKNGHVDMVRMLLENGADPDPQRCAGACLRMAARNGHTEMLALLCKRLMESDDLADFDIND